MALAALLERRTLGAAVATAAVAYGSVVSLACGSASAPKSCNAGAVRACSGAARCAGHQTCRADGASYSACACDASDDASADADDLPDGDRLEADGGRTPFPAAGPTSGRLGATCKLDADCRSALRCVPSSSTAFDGEGPPGGLCTLDCSTNPSACVAIDPAALCVQTGEGSAAYCQAGCELGNPGPHEDKCRGRKDSSCVQAAPNSPSGYCLPTCRNDADCASAKCDLRTGFCASSVPPGDAIGASCDLDLPSCAGFCVGFSETATAAECSGFCTLGGADCEEGKGPPYNAYCLFQASSLSGSGDLGSCAKLCDCDADCGRSDAVCTPYPSGRTLTGRQGYCAFQIANDGGATPRLPCRGTADE